MREKISGTSIAMVFIGTLIGAGFASGQELYQFFARFGAFGLFGVSIAGGLFAFIGYIVLRLSSQNKNLKPEKLMLPFRCRPFEVAVSGLLGAFLFGLIVVMLAGSGALIKEAYSLNPWVGSTAMMALVFITALTGKYGIINSFKIAVPLLIFGMLVVIIFSLLNVDWSDMGYTSVRAKGSWILSAVLFVSYNMILAISVLVPLGKEIKLRPTALKGALLGGAVLGSIGFLAVLVIAVNARALSNIEVPIAHLASQLSPQVGRAYSIFLLIGIYTTAVGCLFALGNKISAVIPFNKRISDLIILSAALFLSNIGFSKLISVIYPVSGYVGMVMLAGIIVYIIKNRKPK